MKSEIITFMLVIAVLSAVASALSVFLARRWGISFGGALSEFGVAAVAGFGQAIVTPLALTSNFPGFSLWGRFRCGPAFRSSFDPCHDSAR